MARTLAKARPAGAYASAMNHVINERAPRAVYKRDSAPRPRAGMKVSKPKKKAATDEPSDELKARREARAIEAAACAESKSCDAGRAASAPLAAAAPASVPSK